MFAEQAASAAIVVKSTDSNLIAMKKFFGFKAGQMLKEFKTEIDQLTPTDQQELGDAIRVACAPQAAI